MIRVVFRFDDPSPVSKRHVEERLFQQFFSRRIPLSCAVIPARIRDGEEVRFTPERSAHLREAATSGLLDVALHGYLHRDSRQVPIGGRSEFVGVPLRRQRELAATGRDLLEDAIQCKVTGFVPPWNSYDAGTLQALEETSFSYLSAEMDRPSRFSNRVSLLPATCVLGELDDVLRQAMRFERHGPVIVVVMHHYDFDQDPDDPPYRVFSYPELGALLDRLAAMPQIRFEHLASLAKALSSRESRLWSKQLLLHEGLPNRFRHHIPRGFLLTRLLPA